MLYGLLLKLIGSCSVRKVYFSRGFDPEELREDRLQSERGHGVDKSRYPACFSAASVRLSSLQRSEKTKH